MKLVEDHQTRFYIKPQKTVRFYVACALLHSASLCFAPRRRPRPPSFPRSSARTPRRTRMSCVSKSFSFRGSKPLDLWHVKPDLTNLLTSLWTSVSLWSKCLVPALARLPHSISAFSLASSKLQETNKEIDVFVSFFLLYLSFSSAPPSLLN